MAEESDTTRNASAPVSSTGGESAAAAATTATSLASGTHYGSVVRVDSATATGPKRETTVLPGGGGAAAAAEREGGGDQRRLQRRMQLKQMRKQSGFYQLSTASFNFGIPTNEQALDHAYEKHGHESWRYKLMKVLHSDSVQFTLMAMLLLDILILFTELALLAMYPTCTLIVRDAVSCCPSSTIDTTNITTATDGSDQHHLLFLLRSLVEEATGASDHHAAADDHGHHEDICENPLTEPYPEYEAGCDPHKWSNVHTAETVLFALTMTILSLMMLELNLSMIALTPQVFFRQVFYAVDYIIVAVSIAMEATFHSLGNDYLQSMIGLLIFFRLWRFVRIAHGLVSVTATMSYERFQELLAYTEELEQLLSENNIDVPVEPDSICELKHDTKNLLYEIEREHREHRFRHHLSHGSSGNEEGGSAAAAATSGTTAPVETIEA